MSSSSSSRRHDRVWVGSGTLAPAVAQLALAAGGLGAVQIVLIYSAGPAPPWQVVLPAVVGWVYVTAGVVAWLRRPSNRTGALLTVGGLAWLASGFLNVPQSTLVAFGLIVQTIGLAVVVHLLHAMRARRLRRVPTTPRSSADRSLNGRSDRATHECRSHAAALGEAA